MGWIAEPLYKNEFGKYNRKDELDRMYNDPKYGKVLKSAMVGTTYYAAYQPANSNDVVALVTLTRIVPSDGCNFHYKDMDETVGPVECKCPASIFSMLTPTTNHYAIEWRERCREYISRKRKGNPLSKLPVGTVIEFAEYDGTVKRLVKMSPAYQFKTAWWLVEGTNQYYRKNNIPQEFKVVA